MKQFFKNLVTAIIGCTIAMGIVFFCIFMFFIIASFSSRSDFTLKKNSILSLKLEGNLVEQASESNPIFDLMGASQVSEVGLDDILSSIKKAKENDKIKGIYIYSGIFSASGASLKEIRDELIDFKTSGKFIVAYGDTYEQGCYYLSSVADKVILNPQGNLDLHGLAATPVFYKGLLDKLGIEMQVFKVGTYKSYVEPYIQDKMSDPNREQVASYIGDAWKTLIGEISQSRNISVTDINRYADSLNVFSLAKTNIERGLVDTLMYETEVKQYLKKLVEIDDDKKLSFASVSNMTSVKYKNKNDADDQIAVLYAEGSITSGEGFDGITDKRFVKELEKLKNDDDVKAVVFRINSGGGSAYASEQIWKAVTDLKAKKPIVVSMGDVAASGGYYIAANASKIVAQPNTITGSIGIFGMFPNFTGLSQKVGITTDHVKTNHFGDFGDFTRPMRDDEKAVMQRYIEHGYSIFISRCAEGRSIPIDSLDKIAQGRVWTGNQALTNGLVDALGDLDFAIEQAAQLAQLADYSVVRYPEKPDFLDQFFGSYSEDTSTKLLKEYLGTDYQMFKTIREMKNQDYIQARMPYDLQIK